MGDFEFRCSEFKLPNALFKFGSSLGITIGGLKLDFESQNSDTLNK